MIAAKELPVAYLSNFARLEKTVGLDRRSRIFRIRKEAINRFAELGFPTTKLEEWKYTDVSAIARTSFRSPEFRVDGFGPELLSDLPLANAAFSECCSRVVFVNGHYNPQLSSPDLPDRVVAGSLASAIKRNIPAVDEHLARHASFERNAFVALNTAFMEDGAFIEVPRGVALQTPIHLLFVSTGDTPIAAHIRNLIVIGDDSQASIVEDYVALGEGGYFTNAVTEVVAGQHSVVDHYKLQAESEQAFHIATLQINQSRASAVTAHSVSLGGGLVRNDVNVVLDGEGAECQLNGVYVTAHKQHVDNHTVIDHAQPHCTSRELYKGILDDESTAVFNGSIIVRKDAQKTDARQSNKNLLLSEDATINSKPQLEINADDVKCSHGTSIGHLEEDSIYYLRSRGVGLEEARAVLTYGFANDVLNRMKLDAVRVRLECALMARMPGRHPQQEES